MEHIGYMTRWMEHIGYMTRWMEHIGYMTRWMEYTGYMARWPAAYGIHAWNDLDKSRLEFAVHNNLLYLLNNWKPFAVKISLNYNNYYGCTVALFMK